MTLTEFLLARIAEDESRARAAAADAMVGARWKHYPADAYDEVQALSISYSKRLLAECEAKRQIVEFHKSWPVLVETRPTFDTDASDPLSMTMRMSKQIAWATEQKYREHFGTEPPSGPIIRALAAVYADHPDYRDEWRP